MPSAGLSAPFPWEGQVKTRAARPDGYDNTVEFADVALGRIRALHHLADPRTFAAWFPYAANCNAAHTQLVDATIAARGGISAAELEKLYGYPPPGLVAERAQKVAASVASEVGDVMAIIDAAVDTVASYRDDLHGATEQLGRAHDRESLRAIVEGLVQQSISMDAQNQALTASLRQSTQEIRQLKEKVELLQLDSLTDPLTLLANRKRFDSELDRWLADPAVAREGLCLLLMDVDHFKRINDTYGHMAGDEVLRTVAHALKQHAKPHDVAARLGGEEFAVLLPKANLRAAMTVAEHLRGRISSMQFMKRSTGESIGRITLSGGIAAHRDGEASWTFIQRADLCLYAAKRHGRNRIVCDDDALAAP
jgi:diguanylate cyclase